MNSNIPFYSFVYQNEQIRERVNRAVMDVFDSAWYVLGNKTELFEQEYARYIGVKHCIGVGNGLDALKIALRVLDIKEGDEVIVPANTYIATVMAVTAVGATPVLVEPDPRTFNIDPLKIEEKITSKTKAIIPVHLYGLPCEMDAIQTLAIKHDLYLVEDNAQASGSLYKGKKTGSLGHVNAHSFYPTKNLGALGDGGAITTNDDEWARKVRLYRNYGSSVKYKNEVLGYNSRLDELQAAVLSVKLDFLDQWLAEKQQLVNVYQQLLSPVTQIELPDFSHMTAGEHSHHLYVIKSKRRDELASYLKEQGVTTLIHYPIPVYNQQAYAGQFASAFPITDRLAAEVLSLPLFPGMTVRQVEEVAFHILAFSRQK
jgi:dTDP-4-amino-4,6-dideoxygalactose transaminase